MVITPIQNNQGAFHLLNSFFYAAKIMVAPLSMSVPLYELVNFTCVGTGDLLTWTVQGDSVTDPSNQDREISVTTYNISVDVWSSVLTIKALPINDGITIQCNVISYNPLDLKQKGATLTVKGKLNTIIIETISYFTVKQRLELQDCIFSISVYQRLIAIEI